MSLISSPIYIYKFSKEHFKQILSSLMSFKKLPLQQNAMFQLNVKIWDEASISIRNTGNSFSPLLSMEG